MNAKPETISWHERARSLSLRTQAFIEGRYVDAASGVTFDSIKLVQAPQHIKDMFSR